MSEIKKRSHAEHQDALNAISTLKQYCEVNQDCDDCIFGDVCRFYWCAEPPIWIDEIKVVSQE